MAPSAPPNDSGAGRFGPRRPAPPGVTSESLPTRARRTRELSDDWALSNSSIWLPGGGADEMSTLVLPALRIEDWPTQPVPAVHLDQRGGPGHLAATSAVDADRMPTWVLPVIRADDLTGATKRIHTAGHSAVMAAAASAESYVQLLRNLATSSGIYALAGLATPLISLVLTPYETHRLSSADYGVLAVLQVALSLGAGVTQLGLYSAFFRAYVHDYSEKRDRHGVLTTTVALLLVVSLAVAVGASAAAPQVTSLLFSTGELLKHPELAHLVSVAAYVLVLQNLAVPGLAWMRAETRPVRYSILAIGGLVVTLLSTVLLLGPGQMGVEGVLYGSGIGYAAQIICTLPVILVRAGLRVRLDIAWNLLSFGVPMIAAVASFWVLQLSDRFLLGRLATLSQAAGYSVSYSMGALVGTVVLVPFGLAWPTALFSIAKRQDAAAIFQLVFRWLSMLLLIIGFALSFAGIFLLKFLFPATYFASAPVIPITALALVFYGVYTILMTGASVRRKTWFGPILVTLAAAINLGANLVLIPRFGAMGAAASTLLAYVVLAVLAYAFNQRIYPIPYEMGRFTNAVLGGVAIFLAGYVLMDLWGSGLTYYIVALQLAAYALWLFFLSGSPPPSRLWKR
ncbi:MAG TPA: lipopolysaccharide biosynthesis protein [Ktedonobacterales bacterium]